MMRKVLPLLLLVLASCGRNKDQVEIKGQFEVIFTTYANNATLTSDAEWLTPVEENFANAGRHVVNINCEANPTEVERSATLLLTSNGITTPITITQERKRD